VHKRFFGRVGVSMLLAFSLLLVFLSPPGAVVQAFNQSNLIRVTEVREVDGQYYYRRAAPVAEFWP
jgi:hypothetical protein